MARIRSAKPEFWTDPKMAALPRDARFTFKGLWEVSADDDGRFQADARIVKGTVWPLDDDITTKKIDRWITLLAECGRIRLYVVEGVRYGVIVNWMRHQKISHPTPSKLPPPPDGPADVRRNKSREVPESLRPDEDRSRGGVEEEGIKSGAEREEVPVDADPLGTAAAPPAPRVLLPDAARDFLDRFYGLPSVTTKRRTDVAAQVYDTLDPNRPGAKLRHGVRVKARDAAHLASCCQAVMDDPPRNADAAIVFLLQKLQDAPPGPTVTEQTAKRHDANVQLEERYAAEKRRAGIRWAHDNPEKFAELRAPVDAEFAQVSDTSFGQAALAAALEQKTAQAAGFPGFDEWQSSTPSTARSA